jgi:translation initiation factor 5B
MPPKKKGNKKVQDDWEADLGESIAPQDAAAEPAAEAPAAEEEAPVSGLMAALAKRGKKKGKKGGQQDWEAELGEDPTAGAANDLLASKAPEEGNLDDDDVFAGNFKPKTEQKVGKQEEKAPATDDAPRVKTKAEKEKEKKEKEKQRKKELVRCRYTVQRNTLDQI